ncbi:MAG TPA: hypothetical protein VIV06_10625 [Candidatus Limnocylindrales bacterium]
MELQEDQTAEIVPAALEREANLIREAIAVVASGVSPRVVIAGLRLGDALLPVARRMALEAGVRIVPMWPADESGVDMSVERLPE